MPGLTEPRQVGAREDLADFISIVDARNTPFLSAVTKGKKPTNTLMQWLGDAYENPDFSGVVDGEDVTDYENAARQRAKMYNHVQVFRRTAKASMLANDVNVIPGGQKEIAVATTKKLVEIKRDMEACLLSTQAAQDDDGAVPHKTRALGSWINTSASQPTYLPTPAAFCPASGQIDASTSLANWTEVLLNTMLQAVFDNTGMIGDFMFIAGSDVRAKFTDMTRFNNTGAVNIARSVRTFTESASKAKITHTTSVYEGDYGVVEVVPSSFIGWASDAPNKKAAYLLDMNKLSVRWNKLPEVTQLPDLGGGPRILIEAVLGLQVDNPKGMARLALA
jgi:hypothetical protein